MNIFYRLLFLIIVLFFASCNFKKSITSDNISKKNYQFINACSSGNVKLVKREIANGQDPRLGGDFINEPICLAVVLQKYEVVKILLNNGVDPNADFGKKGGNLLILAVQTGNFKIVKLLVEHGAKVNRSIGRSPLYSAMIYSPGKIESYIKSKDGVLNKNDLKAIKDLKKQGVILH